MKGHGFSRAAIASNQPALAAEEAVPSAPEGGLRLASRGTAEAVPFQSGVIRQAPAAALPNFLFRRNRQRLLDGGGALKLVPGESAAFDGAL